MKRFMEELQVGRTTVNSDFAYLRDCFGAPISYDREANGHYYNHDGDAFELPGLWLNQSELYALLVCSQLLESVQPGLLKDRLAPLKERINKLLADIDPPDQQINQKIQVRTLQMRQVSDAVFLPVADATLSGRRLAFDYLRRSDNQQATRLVSPQRLLNYRHNWYLLAWCHKAQALRLFSLDMIRAPSIKGEVARQVDPDLLDGFSNSGFGIFTGAAVETCHLRFSHHAGRWVAGEQWHESQQGEWQNDGYHLHVPYTNPTELIMEILRYGEEVEVLAPESLRHLVAEKVKKMQLLYRLFDQ